MLWIGVKPMKLTLGYERRPFGGESHQSRGIPNPIWSERKDSNLRLPAPKAGALPGCATLRKSICYGNKILPFLTILNLYLY